MTKNQKVLLKALKNISNSVLVLEDAYDIVKEMSKKEVEEVINKFSKTITEFDVVSLSSDSCSFKSYADKIIFDIVDKIKEGG